MQAEAARSQRRLCGGVLRRQGVVCRARSGFSLFELLVTISIIGVLAALMAPVLERVRGSAYKAECLSNVRGIAISISMYLTDWDRPWPNEHDRNVAGYFNRAPGGGTTVTWPEICNHTTHANPYLRPAVLLEQYTKSRDVWKCPSAKTMAGASMIVPVGPGGRWVQAYRDSEGKWGKEKPIGPCYVAFPSGWGGAVTDSFVQGLARVQRSANPMGPGAGVFLQGIGVNTNLADLNPSAVHDASRYIACGDAGKQVELWAADGIAYPDQCRLIPCGGRTAAPGRHGPGPCFGACARADWESCPDTVSCGMDPGALERILDDPAYRRTFARHMGGGNIGFLDGHAKWYPSDVIMTRCPPFADAYFEGLCSCWIGNGVIQ